MPCAGLPGSLLDALQPAGSGASAASHSGAGPAQLAGTRASLVDDLCRSLDAPAIPGQRAQLAAPHAAASGPELPLRPLNRCARVCCSTRQTGHQPAANSYRCSLIGV